MLFNGSVDNEFVTVYLSVSCTQIFFSCAYNNFTLMGMNLRPHATIYYAKNIVQVSHNKHFFAIHKFQTYLRN
jgi:hypothetical protein